MQPKFASVECRSTMGAGISLNHGETYT